MWFTRNILVHLFLLLRSDANEKWKSFSIVCFSLYFFFVILNFLLNIVECCSSVRCHTFGMNIHRIILTRFCDGEWTRIHVVDVPWLYWTIWNESPVFGMCNINWKLNAMRNLQLNVFPNNKLLSVLTQREVESTDRPTTDITNTYLPINFHVFVCTFSRCVN